MRYVSSFSNSSPPLYIQLRPLLTKRFKKTDFYLIVYLVLQDILNYYKRIPCLTSYTKGVYLCLKHKC